jgi:hypothetical protein
MLAEEKFSLAILDTLAIVSGTLVLVSTAGRTLSSTYRTFL